MPSLLHPSADSHRQVAEDQGTALVASAVAVRPAQSHLRVVDAVAAGPSAQPYLDARCKVVRIDPRGGSLGSHHAVLGDSATLAPEDTDVMLWDGAEVGDPAWLVSRLAPGGILVAPSSVAGSLRGLGLELTVGLAPGVMVALDRRPVADTPDALRELDRTMCVDRARVLAALRDSPWSGPIGFDVETNAASAQGHRLLEALRQQLDDGEPEVRRLPWPTASMAPSEGAGCDVLAIMPHPDDETIYSGGTLSGLARAGRRVHLVVATDGAGGRGGPGLGSRRAAELIEACAVLGIRSVQCLAWTDTGKYRDAERSHAATAGDALAAWTLERSLGDIVASVRQHRPRTLLSLGPEVDPNLSLHGHHLAVGLLVAVGFHLAALPEFRPELGPAWAAGDHRAMESPLVAAGPHTAIVPIDPRAKLRALRCHRTQQYSTRRLMARLEAGAPAECSERTRRVQARRTEVWNLVAPLEGTPPFATAPTEGWSARARAVTARPRDREGLVAMLRRQSCLLPPDAARSRSLEMLLRSDAVVVVTGQQVGWLGGPAYTLVKALAAVDLARRLQAEGIPTIPVFWMASGDHDLAEVVAAPTLDGASIRLNLPDRGIPVGGLKLPSDVDEARKTWLAQLPSSIRERAAGLSEAYRVGASLADAFARTLADLTAGTGLLMFDSTDAQAARWARPLFERDLLGDDPARARLLEAPQPHVVPVQRDVAQVFFVDDAGRRQRLRRTRDGVSWIGGSLDHEALAAVLEDAPERFCAAALLRPVVQDHVLPTIATIAGPTERRYLAQMQTLYAWADVVPSHVVQRPSLHPMATADVRTLEACGGLEVLFAHPKPTVALGMAGLGSQTRDWLARCEDLSARVFARREHPHAQDATELTHAWSGLRKSAPAALDGLRTAGSWAKHCAAVDERLSGSAGARDLTAVARRLFQIRRSLLRDGRRARPELVAAWRRVQRTAERRMTTAELCARWGPDTVRTILAAFASLDSGGVALLGGAP